MSGNSREARGDQQWWAAGMAILVLIGAASAVPGQTSAPTAAPSSFGQIVFNNDSSNQSSTPANNGIVQAGCSTCAGGLPSGDIGCAGCGSACYPGRKPCTCCWNPDTCVGRLLAGVYECICCPDPCYEPHWVALADAAFFVDAARPVTQMRLRYDAGFHLTRPDRAEYFWARESTSPNQLEPQGPCARHGFGKGPPCIASSVDYEDLSLYMEGAADRVGVFVETFYREVDPKTDPLSLGPPINGQICCPNSGFGDLLIGTKTLLLDCELLQISFQFKTFIPTASAGKGLGTGHVSLEPALLWALRLSDLTYLQGEVAYWIPIGGDPLFEGDVFHAHFSLNRILWQPCPDIQLIGTAELNEWSVLGGNFTEIIVNPATGLLAPAAISGSAGMVSIGPGIRLVICDKIDFGVGTAFALTSDHWADQLIRSEFRWRF